MARAEGKAKGGFTLVELLIVIAMLLILSGSVTSAVSSARQRAKISQATSDVQQMTNAIYAYENYGEAAGQNPLARHVMEDQEATESAMAFILGREPLRNGQSGMVPVLFNAHIRNGAIRDPWGRPYLVTVRRSASAAGSMGEDARRLESRVAFPNFYRIPAK